MFIIFVVWTFFRYTEKNVLAGAYKVSAKNIENTPTHYLITATDHETGEKSAVHNLLEINKGNAKLFGGAYTAARLERQNHTVHFLFFQKLSSQLRIHFSTFCSFLLVATVSQDAHKFLHVLLICFGSNCHSKRAFTFTPFAHFVCKCGGPLQIHGMPARLMTTEHFNEAVAALKTSLQQHNPFGVHGLGVMVTKTDNSVAKDNTLVHVEIERTPIHSKTGYVPTDMEDAITQDHLAALNGVKPAKEIVPSVVTESGFESKCPQRKTEHSDKN